MPPILFASRRPIADASAVPGLGPVHRTAAPGGKLLIREESGRVRPFLDGNPFHDVSDPAVSWSGDRVAFAALAERGGDWRIQLANADGSRWWPLPVADPDRELSALGPDADRFLRWDDLDPCWLPDGRICFASTRFPQVAQQHGIRTTNLFAVSPEGGPAVRITSERNGAEEPTVDPVTGRIVYARWWFNRYRASSDPAGITTDPSRAVPFEEVDLWQAITIGPDGNGARLAGGNPLVRGEMMAYQPLVLRDGTLVGVAAEVPGMAPSPGRTRVQLFPGGIAPARRPAGNAAACAPVELPDGRILLSLDPDGRGDLGLFVVSPSGGEPVRVADARGRADLDAAVLAPRPRPPVLPDLMARSPRRVPVTEEAQLDDGATTFRFDCLNVFSNAGIDVPIPDAPVPEPGIRIRFFATLARPSAAGGDTVVLVRESPVGRGGGVHEHGLPADTPLFEQLVNARGEVLRSAGGPAHVSGLNSGRFGGGTHCVGCHVGHSAIEVPPNYSLGKRFNASPGARVAASSVAPGNAGGRAAVDRRTLGPLQDVAWVAEGRDGESLSLSWALPVVAEEAILYAVRTDTASGTDLRVEEVLLTLWRGGREVGRAGAEGELRSDGTRIDLPDVPADSLEVRFLRATGRIAGEPRAGLAEIETLGRILEGD